MNIVPESPAKEEKTVVIEMDEEKLARIDRIAAVYHMDRDEFICRCIHFTLENLEDPSVKILR